MTYAMRQRLIAVIQGLALILTSLGTPAMAVGRCAAPPLGALETYALSAKAISSRHPPRLPDVIAPVRLTWEGLLNTWRHLEGADYAALSVANSFAWAAWAAQDGWTRAWAIIGIVTVFDLYRRGAFNIANRFKFHPARPIFSLREDILNLSKPFSDRLPPAESLVAILDDAENGVREASKQLEAGFPQKAKEVLDNVLKADETQWTIWKLMRHRDIPGGLWERTVELLEFAEKLQSSINLLESWEDKVRRFLHPKSMGQPVDFSEWILFQAYWDPLAHDGFDESGQDLAVKILARSVDAALKLPLTIEEFKALFLALETLNISVRYKFGPERASAIQELAEKVRPFTQWSTDQATIEVALNAVKSRRVATLIRLLSDPSRANVVFDQLEPKEFMEQISELSDYDELIELLVESLKKENEKQILDILVARYDGLDHRGSSFEQIVTELHGLLVFHANRGDGFQDNIVKLLQRLDRFTGRAIEVLEDVSTVKHTFAKEGNTFITIPPVPTITLRTHDATVTIVYDAVSGLYRQEIGQYDFAPMPEDGVISVGQSNSLHAAIVKVEINEDGAIRITPLKNAHLVTLFVQAPEEQNVSYEILAKNKRWLDKILKVPEPGDKSAAETKLLHVNKEGEILGLANFENPDNPTTDELLNRDDIIVRVGWSRVSQRLLASHNQVYRVVQWKPSDKPTLYKVNIGWFPTTFRQTLIDWTPNDPDPDGGIHAPAGALGPWAWFGFAGSVLPVFLAAFGEGAMVGNAANRFDGAWTGVPVVVALLAAAHSLFGVLKWDSAAKRWTASFGSWRAVATGTAVASSSLLAFIPAALHQPIWLTLATAILPHLLLNVAAHLYVTSNRRFAMAA